MTRRAGPFLAGVAAFALYATTISPGLFWGDSAQLQLLTAQPSLGIGVRDYPLWTALSSILTRILGCDPTTGANLFGVACGAVAVGLCFAFVRRLTGSAYGAAVAAATLAVSHLLWATSTVAEVYPAAAALIFLLLLILTRSLEATRWPAFLFGLVVGISLLHHRQVQIVAVAMLLPFLWNRRAGRPVLPNLGAAAAGFLVGGLPVLLIAFRSAGPLPAQVDEFLLGSFEIRPPAGIGLGQGLLGLLLYELRFLLLCLPGPQLLLVVPGLRIGPAAPGPWRSRLLCVAGASALFPLLFPHLGDRFVLLLPAVCVSAVLAGIGAAAYLSRRSSRTRLIVALAVPLLPVATYALLSSENVLDRAGFFSGATAEHRRAFLWPGHSGDRRASEFGERVLAALPPDSAVFTGWGDGEVLRYLRQVRGVRTDVLIRPYPRRRRGVDPIADAAPRRCFFSSYPHLPLPVPPPPGYRLVEILPDTLWEVRPLGSDR